ncbi:GvpL/GvpF family gas vesicle protein [Ancylobacter sp. FA202]|uniref:GvpL/GvpF family gas vesicle protein n=1 Tax=Ancylobacter sp. FA202 TaxID=1111106 RepID=UPI00036AB346|nr:GvpL/GvpF family gas vesicle protein [Ancylobacter sp. FA202]
MLYVYAITAHHAAGAEPRLPEEGILPGVAVQHFAAGPLGAVASTVPDSIFGKEVLQALLNDADWTRARILDHQRVVSSLLPVATVLPLKFGTLFAGETSLISALASQREVLEATVTRLRGTREWGVKLFFEAPTRPVRTAEPVGAGSGLAFFRRKKEEQEARAAAEVALDHCVAGSHRRLAALARAAVANPLQPPELHGHAGTMGLNGAYLVASETEAAWRACLSELETTYAADGARYVLTGPWAAYNFTGGGLV